MEPSKKKNNKKEGGNQEEKIKVRNGGGSQKRKKKTAEQILQTVGFCSFTLCQTLQRNQRAVAMNWKFTVSEY